MALVDAQIKSAVNLRWYAQASCPDALTDLRVSGPDARGPFRALGAQFTLTVTPSASVWRGTREAARTSVPRAQSRALVLADPAVDGSPDGRIVLRGLPGARREARTIANLLQLPADALREGREASERYLKQADLGSVRLLHLLRGRLVVLSSCDAADGAVQGGEGTLSLARAFFAAGASTVVATRWPVRDDDAAWLMERFYAALAAGADVAAALRQARLDAADAGLPAAAWAGVTVFGDGALAPLPPQSPLAIVWRSRRPAIAASLAIALAIVALVLLVARRPAARHQA